jgi:peptide/nickel transport system substrate-binding protein
VPDHPHPWGRQFGRRTFLKSTAIAGGALAAGPLLISCGDDDDDDAPGVTATATTAGTSAQPTATEAQDFPEEFVIALEREPADMMPFFSGFDQATALRAINETLVYVNMTDPQGNGVAEVSYEGVLAESWELAEPTAWLFKLREGATFHDETPFDAEAAKFAFDLFGDGELVQSLGKFPLASRYIQSVEAVDASTLRINTNTPIVEQEFFGFGFYLGFAAFSPTAHEAAGGFEGMRTAPVGTGPYRFDQWRSGQDMTLVRNEAYWGALPNMQRLRFIFRPEASVRAQTIASGESHFAYSIGPEQASALDNSVVGAGFQSNSLRLNNTRQPTMDIRVRRAINYALDRDAVNDAIFHGTARPIGFFAYQPVHVPVWPYDPQRARTLLDEAGAAGQEVEFVYGEGRLPEEDQLAEVYAAQIEAIGLKVKLTKVERAQYAEISGGEFAQMPEILMETTSSGNYGEISGSLTDKYGCDGSGTFCDPGWDAEFAALLSLGGEERLAKIQDVATRLQEEETPRVWMLAVNQVHGLAPNVRADVPLNVYPRIEDLAWA